MNVCLVTIYPVKNEPKRAWRQYTAHFDATALVVRHAATGYAPATMIGSAE